VKRFGIVAPALLISAATALIAWPLVVLLTGEFGLGDLGIILYWVAVALLAAVLVPISLGIGLLRKGRYKKVSAAALIGILTFLAVTSVVTLGEGRLRPSVLWLVWSQRYKSEVLASSALKGEFKHIEWDGDGWGNVTMGDWMGYVVFDPSDSLSDATNNDAHASYTGIPCTVVQVHRLERQWYSVVTDRNEFWECGREGSSKNVDWMDRMRPEPPPLWNERRKASHAKP
jgi:hypothetical protein